MYGKSAFEPAATDRKSPPPRLLVADDDPGFRRAVAFLLSGSGFQVVEAADGALAKRAIDVSWMDGSPFEILLLDIRMDGATGWEVLAHSRERTPAGEQAPRVLLMTGVVAEIDRMRARREGAARILVKPIPCEVLLSEIARLGRIPRDFPAIHDASLHLSTTA